MTNDVKRIKKINDDCENQEIYTDFSKNKLKAIKILLINPTKKMSYTEITIIRSIRICTNMHIKK